MILCEEKTTDSSEVVFAFPERDSDEEETEKEEEEDDDDDDDDDDEMEVYEKLDAGCEERGDEGGKERRGDGDATAQNTNCHDKEYYPNSGPKTKDEHERQTKLRLMIIRQRDKEFKTDEKFKSKSIVQLNNEAVNALKSGDDIEAIAKYAKVFRKAHENNLTHELMHVCHSNRAVAYLNLGLFEEALWDANKSQDLANKRYYRTQSVGGQVINVFVKGYARKGFALMGLRMHRLAKSVFETGLEFCPQDEELKRKIEDMREHEKEHFEFFDKEIQKRNIKPTKLLPLWDLMGITLGFGTAMMGKKAAMLCTASVEEVIDGHYKDQTYKLREDEEELKKKIMKFRQDELDHKDIAYESGATKSGLYSVLDKVIKTSSRIAIAISEKI